MRHRFSACEYVELKPDTTPENYAQVMNRALAAEQIVLAMIVKPAAWYRFGLLPEQDRLVCELTAKCDCVLACLGSPVALEKYHDATVRICTFSDVFVSQEALAKFLSSHESATTA